MATLADSLLSSTARSLALRKRPDLTHRKHRYQGQVYWVVKEPVGLNYFRFQEEEFFILQQLDGQVSLDELKERFEEEFPPQKITVEELQQFIGTLHRSGLVIANVPGQGLQLKKRRDERRRKELLSAVANILSLRFKGIDPDRLLNWMHRWLWWLFSWPAVAAWCVLAASAGLLVAVQFDVFQSKLPSFHQFFTLENAMWLAVAMGATKVVHEFGHGLTCKHFGGECHEMGVMLLVLTPCLYCNVSDSWMLPNKWQRAMIGAAGMYVEIAIASVCTFLWWFSEPGFLNQICLSTMFVCSVSTLIFNGNPLLRYDGYYILSDILEIPNLRQKATDILSRKLLWWCLGVERPDDPFLPQRNQLMFAAYTVAAVAYRWFVTFSILFFLYKVFEPYRLEIIGQIIACMSLYGLLVQPLYKLWQFFWIPGRVEKVKKPRVYATIGVVAAILLAIVYVPLPFRVYTPLVIKARDAAPVYVTVPGRLDRLDVKLGQRVDAGQRLAQLSNIDLDLDLAQFEGQLQQVRLELVSLKKFRVHSDPSARLIIGGLEETEKSLVKQITEKQDDIERLTLKAEVAGVTLPAAYNAVRPDPNEQLPGWSGLATDAKNRGCYMNQSEMLCLIGDPKKLEANLTVDQADLNFVHEGQRVQIKLDELPFHTFEGVIDQISNREMTSSPKQLSNKSGGELATKTDEAGVERPMSTSYLARVLLDNDDELLRLGLTGRAKIHAGSRTLGQRFWRYVAQTFNFQL